MKSREPRFTACGFSLFCGLFVALVLLTIVLLVLFLLAVIAILRRLVICLMVLAHVNTSHVCELSLVLTQFLVIFIWKFFYSE